MAIIAHAEAIHAKHSATETDLKLPLSREQLLALVGEGGEGHTLGARRQSHVSRVSCDDLAAMCTPFGCAAFSLLGEVKHATTSCF